MAKRRIRFILILFLSCLCPRLAGANPPDIGLIRPETLHAETGAWAILDGRPRSAWKSSHLPGALSFSWEDYTRIDEKKIPYRVFSPEELAAILGKMGIDENTPVAAYGDMDVSWGGEAWICWVFSWIGHKGPIRLVRGGLNAWGKAGFLFLSGSDSGTIRPKQYRLDIRNELNLSAGDIENLKSDIHLVDTRSFREWITGDRLPGAVHIAWTKFYAGPNKVPLDASALASLLKENGIPLDKPVVYYCTGGIRSSLAWMTHTLSRRGSALNFEGGTEEWIRRKSIHR
jgi:thiosulfate/3-mercaptopyruvate sulfurtransferase